MAQCVLLLQLLLLTSAAASKDYFTSTAHISQLLAMRCRLADALLGYANNEMARLDRVREFAEDLRVSGTRADGEAEAAAEERAENPVTAFLTIRRMGQDWRRLLGNCSDAPDMVLRSTGVELPTSEDYDGAADALVRLQDVYGISAESMARGQLSVGSEGLPSDSGSQPLLLTVDDCLQLARRAFKRSLDLIGMDWVRLVTSGTFPLDQVISRARPALLDILQSRFEQISQVDLVCANLGRLWQYAQGNVSEVALRASDVVKTVVEGQADKLNYKKLCKDGSITRTGSSSHLVCRHTVPHPFFTLAPVKEELLSQDPRVVFLYDVLTDGESARLMEVAAPRLHRAKVITGKFTDLRISKSAFLQDSDDWSVRQVNRKVAYITGLNVTDSDLLQMGNYGIGGQYEPHMDSFGSGVLRGNNRVATVLLYLNNVEQGGGTVFTRLGLRVLPVKNAALFWYNMRRNSSDMFDTTHAACPVLEGSKWVANKWIYYLGQVQHRPCSLDPLE